MKPPQARKRYHPTDFGEQQWSRLLDFVFERAELLEVAIPYPYVAHNLDRAPLFSPALEALREAVVDRYVSTIRWGSAQAYATQFVRLRLDPRVCSFVRSQRRLEGWSWRRLMPEDPCFLAGGSILLATESADGRIAVFADEAERSKLRDSGIRLIEPLGVEAEPWPTP